MKIFEAGIQAPSGENCQPWRFKVVGDSIEIYNIPEKDTSLYNFRQFGSLVAHGALLENIFIASRQLGYVPSLNIFPKSQDSELVATVSLEHAKPKEDILFPCIARRLTNRNKYTKRILSEDQKKELLESSMEIGVGELKFVEEDDKKKILAEALVLSDRMLFENRKLHDFLFEHIVWNSEEMMKKRSGFYIKELALPLPIEKLFSVLRNWKKVELFNKIGFSKLAAKGNIKLYSSVGAIGAILMDSNGPNDFVMAGRLMQRIWLKATNMGLSIQPATGVIFFMQRVLANEASDFSDTHIELIKQSYKTISDMFRTNDKTIAMLFRIGHSTKQGVKSLRLPPHIVSYE